AEVVFMKAGNELVILFKDHAYIDGNDRDIDLDGEVAESGRVLRLCRRRKRRGRFGLGLFRESDGAGVAGGTSGGRRVLILRLLVLVLVLLALVLRGSLLGNSEVGHLPEKQERDEGGDGDEFHGIPCSPIVGRGGFCGKGTQSATL